MAKQLEVMKIVPFDPIRKPRSLVLAFAGFLIPVFGVVFYLIFALLRRYSPLLAVAVLLGGAALVFYLVWRAVNSVRT